MNLNDIARAYIAATELDERIRTDAPRLAEDISILRADLHALLMQALRDNQIPFTDRQDAARIAQELCQHVSSR